MSQTIDLVQVLEKINQFSNEREWDQFHSIKNLSMALSVESSELVEIYQWLSEEESNDKSNLTLKTRTQDEIADIFIYLLKIADKLEINLEEAVNAKLTQNAEKYPVDKSKGNSKKYDEL